VVSTLFWAAVDGIKELNTDNSGLRVLLEEDVSVVFRCGQAKINILKEGDACR
jgi:hypothetical protein